MEPFESIDVASKWFALGITLYTCYLVYRAWSDSTENLRALRGNGGKLVILSAEKTGAQTALLVHVLVVLAVVTTIVVPIEVDSVRLFLRVMLVRGCLVGVSLLVARNFFKQEGYRRQLGSLLEPGRDKT